MSFLIGADTTLEPPRFINVEGRGVEGPPDERASHLFLSELTGTATSSSFAGDDVDSLGGIANRAPVGGKVR